MGNPEGESFSPGSRSFTSAGPRAGPDSRADSAYRGPSARILRRLSQHGPRGIHIVLAADEQRDALMQLGRMDIQHTLRPISGGATGLLDDERERIGLVKKPQLAAPVPAVGRIREESAAEEVAMEIGNERADVARVH